MAPITRTSRYFQTASAGAGRDTNRRPPPTTIRPSAVLNFIVARPGSTDFSAGIPRIDPNTTIAPISTAPLAAIVWGHAVDRLFGKRDVNPSFSMTNIEPVKKHP